MLLYNREPDDEAIYSDIAVANLCVLLHKLPSEIKNEYAEEIWKLEQVLEIQAEKNAPKHKGANASQHQG